MTAEQVTYANGWYKFTNAHGSTFQEVFFGHTDNNEPVEAWLALGYTIEPAVVMSQAEFDTRIIETYAKAYARGVASAEWIEEDNDE